MGGQIGEFRELIRSLAAHPHAVMSPERFKAHSGLLLEPDRVHAAGHRERNVGVLGGVESADRQPERAQTVVPMCGECSRLDRLPF